MKKITTPVKQMGMTMYCPIAITISTPMLPTFRSYPDIRLWENDSWFVP